VTQTRLSRIGKYEVESVVGEGAMGVVYCALDSMLNRRVAIKVMSDAIAQDTDLRERFLREAQAAGSLQHPNVVTVYDFGEVDVHLYIAMEYVEGEDLEDLLHSKIAIPLDAKLELIIGVLHGLAFAHKRGVIHRDIKPANIRVDEEGKARIMDFGVAHLASSDMTRTGTMLGTPSYMAPEQIVGAPVGPETDIFSVGAVLYELLTDVRPFKGDTLQTLMYQILSATPLPVHQVMPALPAELNRIVMRALQKEPKDRYARALDMANDLAMVKASRTHDGHTSSISLRATIDSALAERYAGAQRVARRRQVTAIATGAVGTILLLGAGYVGWKWNSSPDQPPGAPLVSTSAAGTIPDPGPSSNTPVPTQDRPDSSPSAPAAANEPAARTPADAQTKTGTPPSRPTVPTARELALARDAQRFAMEARRRATEAGASLERLRAGDAQNSSGESLLNRGRTVEAGEAFNRAAREWTNAERVTREEAMRAADALAKAPPVVGVPAGPVVPLVGDPRVARPLAGATSTVPPPTTPVPPPRPPADPSAEIGQVVAAYARAIESRDIATLRRAYPGMTDAQRSAFEGFFRDTRSLDASLTVSDLQVNGSAAEARLSGTYEFVTSSGTPERRPVSFRASLVRENGVWKLMMVR
jgi:eukaryotic-like serine/threonine-protein kinase